MLLFFGMVSAKPAAHHHYGNLLYRSPSYQVAPIRRPIHYGGHYEISREIETGYGG